MGCRWWCAVLVVNEWNIDRPLFLKVGRERGRELVQAKGARMPPPSMTDTTHTHTQTDRADSTAMPVARQPEQRCLLGVPLSSQAEESRAPPFGFR